MEIDIDLMARYDLRMQVRTRKHLPHEMPLWIDPGKEIYFLTICGEPRGKNQLARSEMADQIFQTLAHRNKAGVWFVHFGLLMPDHVHMLVSFPHSGKRVQTIVSKWKEWTSKDLGIQWQRDFFEHRLRRDESYRQKADYIWANPVRAGLVSRIEIGHTCLLPKDMEWQGRDAALRRPWSAQRADSTKISRVQW